MVLYDPTSAKVGHLHPIYLYILAVVLKSFWIFGLKICVRLNTWMTKIIDL